MIKSGSPFVLGGDVKMENSEEHGHEMAAKTKTEEYATVCFLEDADLANDYQVLFESNDIPVSIEEKEGSDSEHTYVVMVPEQYLDEAHVLIEAQVSYDDFYDFPLDDDGETPYDDDMYDEEY